MTTDIRLLVSFKDHRKRKRLAYKIGPEGVLALIDLWLTIAETRPETGDLSGMSVEDIELDAGWCGEPGAFVAAAVESGWIDRHEDGTLALHGWAENQPYLATTARRQEHARTAALARWGRRTDADRAAKGARSMPGAALAMPGACQIDAPSRLTLPTNQPTTAREDGDDVDPTEGGEENHIPARRDGHMLDALYGTSVAKPIAKRLGITVSDQELAKWGVAVSDVERAHGIAPAQQAELSAWYAEHMDDKYMPQVASPADWREKCVRIKHERDKREKPTEGFRAAFK